MYSNTWWASSAESAVVLAVSQSIDTNEGIKMKLTNNTVYDNVNKIPYYNPNYAWDYSPIGGLECASYSACEQEVIEGCPWQCRYGKKTQDYIIDGMGVCKFLVFVSFLSLNCRSCLFIVADDIFSPLYF